MNIVGGVMLTGGGEVKIVSGSMKHSRFIISAHVVERATARPTCDALEKVMRAYGVEPKRISRELRNELAGIHSARRGTYRILYRINDDKRTVTVIRIDRRRDVYRT